MFIHRRRRSVICTAKGLRTKEGFQHGNKAIDVLLFERRKQWTEVNGCSNTCKCFAHTALLPPRCSYQLFPGFSTWLQRPPPVDGAGSTGCTNGLCHWIRTRIYISILRLHDLVRVFFLKKAVGYRQKIIEKDTFIWDYFACVPKIKNSYLFPKSLI